MMKGPSTSYVESFQRSRKSPNLSTSFEENKDEESPFRFPPNEADDIHLQDLPNHGNPFTTDSVCADSMHRPEALNPPFYSTA